MNEDYSEDYPEWDGDDMSEDMRQAELAHLIKLFKNDSIVFTVGEQGDLLAFDRMVYEGLRSYEQYVSQYKNLKDINERNKDDNED